MVALFDVASKNGDWEKYGRTDTSQHGGNELSREGATRIRVYASHRLSYFRRPPLNFIERGFFGSIHVDAIKKLHNGFGP